jgi:hypothetical protein
MAATDDAKSSAGRTATFIVLGEDDGLKGCASRTD